MASTAGLAWVAKKVVNACGMRVTHQRCCNQLKWLAWHAMCVATHSMACNCVLQHAQQAQQRRLPIPVGLSVLYHHHHLTTTNLQHLHLKGIVSIRPKQEYNAVGASFFVLSCRDVAQVFVAILNPLDTMQPPYLIRGRPSGHPTVTLKMS